MVWLPATEKDISAARTGISSEDFSQVFRGDVDLTFEVIRSRFKANGHNHTDEESGRIRVQCEGSNTKRYFVTGSSIVVV